MPRLDPDDPLDAIEPRARTTCLNDVVVDRLLIPLSLLAFWVALIGSVVGYWAAHEPRPQGTQIFESSRG
jgi:hypothetical protein